MCGVVLGQQQNQSLPHQHRGYPRDWRRRSADVGGLHLATEGLGQGQGWMGGDAAPVETVYAELLSDMYTETLNSVNDNILESLPAELPESTRSRLIHSLDRWHFEPHKLPEEEVLACTLILFETLFRIEGMREVIPVPMPQICAFIHHLRRIYRLENTYHNFEHALDVLQACQSYLKSAGMVPSPKILFENNRLWKPKKAFNSGSPISCLGLREVFTLYIAAIGHDVGHPGFTNGFMQKAKTPLSIVFGSSALENMHCQLLLRVMRHNGLGAMLDDPKHGVHFRKVLWESVIATDMGVHKNFMERFKDLVDGEAGTLSLRQILVCQALLKNADISNPTRPFNVSKHWATALMQEWTAQAQLEEEYQVETTVPSMSMEDPLAEAGSQIFFIGTFAKPLLELTVKAVPDMSMYLTHCKRNLRTWQTRKADLIKSANKRAAKAPSTFLRPPPSSAPPAFSARSTSASSSSSSLPPPPSSSSSLTSLSQPPPTSPRQSDVYLTAFPLALPPKIFEPMFPRFEETLSSLSPSVPVSPSESDSSASLSLFSPLSDASGSMRCTSSSSTSGSGSSTGKNTHATNGSMSSNGSATHLTPPTVSTHEAIRAAGRLGSIGRKDGKSIKSVLSTSSATKKNSRNSWCAPTGGLNSFFALSGSSSWSPHSPALSQIPGSTCSSTVASPVLPSTAIPASLSAVANAATSDDSSAGVGNVKEDKEAASEPLSALNAPPLPPSVGSLLMARPIKLQLSP